MTFRLTVLALLAVLGGCKADTARDGADRRGAEGEVLGGTISDAMIPLESVKSQSPAQRPVAAATGEADEADEAGEDGVDAEVGAEVGAGGAEQPREPSAPPDSGE